MPLIRLAGPGLVVTFDRAKDRLLLAGLKRRDGRPMLFADRAARRAGTGPIAGPLAMIVRGGEHAGLHAADRFVVESLQADRSRLLAYLRHEAMAMQVAVEVDVEGHVATWRAQVCWHGETPLDAEFYFPILSRVRFSRGGRDRAVLARLSGSVLAPLGRVNFRNAYLGQFASPAFLVEGGGRGLAVLDDNRADYAADPAASLQRSFVIANQLPVPEKASYYAKEPEGGADGPIAAVCHARLFRPASYAGAAGTADTSGEDGGTLPMRCTGDAADLGPVRTYAYRGSWKAGASWLRDRRSWVPMRTSPARWFQRNTFIGEDMGDALVRAGRSFLDYPKLLAAKRRLGADVFHLPGFHDPEVLGTHRNWLNRGDYVFAAQNLGGFEAARRGVEAVHRAGGRVLYYVEGLIMWKRSRIGRSQGRRWALMEPDGSYTEHYQGFWHMCPACAAWRRWLAAECAEIVRSTGVDGFFVDSTCATHYHRCFNPDHGHPHPDVWNWGVRRMLGDLRAAVDEVNPETILLVEGVGDLAREFADGSLAHTHCWTRGTFGEPIARFLHPQMRAYESWGSSDHGDPYMPETSPRRLHVWNFVTGQRIYAHNPDADEMAPAARRARQYHDLYPEICDAPLAEADARCRGAICQLFESRPRVVTVGNLTGGEVRATLELPSPAGLLFDRLDARPVPVAGGKARLPLGPWEFRAFEIRP